MSGTYVAPSIAHCVLPAGMKYAPPRSKRSCSSPPHSGHCVVAPISTSRASSLPSTTTTSKSSHAGRCRLITTVPKPVARRTADATAASTGCRSPPARIARPISSSASSASWRLRSAGWDTTPCNRPNARGV